MKNSRYKSYFKHPPLWGLVGLLLALVLTISSCQDSGWEDIDTTAAQAYGNNSITEHNVITIAQLKAMSKYKKAITASRDTCYVSDDIQLKLYITGNDVGGNIYNYVSAVDEKGDAILIYIYAGGLYSYLPVGQEILVNLQGLYVGANGTQPCISTPYMTSSGNVYPKNMSFFLWMQHMKITGFNEAKAKPEVYTATEFANAWKSSPDKLAGKLVTIKGITLKEADGTKTWGKKSELASVNDYTVKRYFKELNTSIYANTSTSAKFAAEIMPTGKIDLTCIIVRYGNYAQLTLRTADDAKTATN